MRYLVVYFIAFNLFITTGCNKEKLIPVDEPELIGTYEWSMSITATGDVVESSKIADKYAIIIEKDGMIYTVKNGKVKHRFFFYDSYLSRGRIHVVSYPRLRKKIHLEPEFHLIFRRGEVQANNFPFLMGLSNFFYKVD